MDFGKIFGEYGVEKYIAHIELILDFCFFFTFFIRITIKALPLNVWIAESTSKCKITKGV